MTVTDIHRVSINLAIPYEHSLIGGFMACLECYINQAEYILDDCKEVNDLKEVISNLKIPLTVGYAAEAYPINQKILNAMIRKRLKHLGWEIKGVRMAPKEHGLKIGQKGDFRRVLDNGLRIFGEVEFGYIASIFRDFFKFSFVRDIDTYDLGILVVPSENFAKEVEGCYSFQSVKRILDHTKGSIQTPLAVFGIEPNRDEDIDCLPLEPDWGRKEWRSQSEPTWDEFVTKHADVLF